MQVSASSLFWALGLMVFYAIYIAPQESGMLVVAADDAVPPSTPSKSPTPSTSPTTPKPECVDAAVLTRLKSQLTNAEIRATNAENESTLLKKNQETSIQACVTTSEKQSADLKQCRAQEQLIAEKFNASQDEKMQMQKDLIVLKGKLSNAELSQTGESKKLGDEKKKLEADAKQALETAQKSTTEAKRLELEVDRLSDELKTTKESSTSTMEEVQKAAERKLKTATLSMENAKKQSQQKIAQLEEEVTALREVLHAKQSQASEMTQLFSYEALSSCLSSVYLFYKALASHVVWCIPEDVYLKGSLAYLEIKTFADPYLDKVKPYWESAFSAASSQYDAVAGLYAQHVKPQVDQQISNLYLLVETTWMSKDEYVSQMNGKVDELLRPFFANHPEVKPLVPEGFTDRLLFLLFVSIILVFGLVLMKKIVWMFVCTTVSVVLPCCCKRRRDKVLKTKSSRTSKKSFTPASVTGQQTMKKPKDGVSTMLMTAGQKRKA